MLDADDQQLFARLSIFAGPWTLEAADEVCNLDGTRDLVEGVESLVDKSLVQQEDRTGEPQFAILQTIREYAMEKLRLIGEADRLRERHAGYVVQLVETYGSLEAFLAGDTPHSLEVLDTGREDVRAALGAALEFGDAETALKLSGTLAVGLWYIRGYWNEGKRWTEGALGLPAGSELAGPRAHALMGLGTLLWLLNDWATARATLKEGIALAGSDDPWIVFASTILGWVAAAEGDLVTARHVMEDTLAAARQSGTPWQIAEVLHSLGGLDVLQQEYDRAGDHLQEALALVPSSHTTWGIGFMHNTVGDLARLRGHYAEAEDYYERSLREFEATNNANGQASATHNLGYVALYRGEVDRAEQQFRVALDIFRFLGDQRGIAECFIGLASVAAVRKQPERAARLSGIAERALHDVGAVQSQLNIPESEAYLALARSQISEEPYQAARDAGWAMDSAEAVAYALKEPDPMAVQV